MQPLKIWITEYTDDASGVLIGPYIKAHTQLEANSIANQFGLAVIGEIVELKHNQLLDKRVLH
jgi:hypothetical protein|tara:strand:+ start:257 stop:445 length:189 start_codon:yes stop_codon:yes gene_type:complete